MLQNCRTSTTPYLLAVLVQVRVHAGGADGGRRALQLHLDEVVDVHGRRPTRVLRARAERVVLVDWHAHAAPESATAHRCDCKYVL